MIVLDAYALEAYFTMETSAPIVRDLLATGEQTLISGINLAEILDRMIRVHGASPAELEANLLDTGVHVTGVDEAIAFSAARLRATHYHRDRRAVSIADCCAAALALDRDAPLVTSDPALLGLIADENGRYMALPDSSGIVWSP
ncbi:MAG: PIN domain-containing protein [Actinomycetota bacterium]|nr:PIN domain-containing protein [Actinomycetota bacterium]